MMIKKYFMFAVLAASSFSAMADDLQSLATAKADEANLVTKEVSKAKTDSVVWTFPCTIGLNFGQTAYQNWAEGGDNTISFGAYANLNANYKKEKVMWNNNLFGEYGFIRSEAYDYEKLRKNLDKLTATSKFGYKASKNWYYSALVDFKSQFNNGYDYTKYDAPNGTQRDTAIKNSDFLAPAHVVASVGMDYIPNKYLSLFVSPATGRFTICREKSLSTLWGLDEGERHKAEFGAYLRILNDFDIVKNIRLTSKFEYFQEWGKGSDDLCNSVVDWNLLLSMKVTKFITASVRGELKYDKSVPYIDADDIDAATGEPKQHGARIQLMDAINVGFAYTF